MKWECYHHVQNVEAMLRGAYVNIAWDAITLYGAHTLSDRAVVNKCVSEKLSECVGHKLLELNCNVLDSFAISFKVCKELK